MRHYAVIWCNELRFLQIFTYHLTAAACNLRHRTNLQLLQPAGIYDWLTDKKVVKIHKYCRNYRVYFCPSAQDNSSSGVNNSSSRTQKRGFLRPCYNTMGWLGDSSHRGQVR